MNVLVSGAALLLCCTAFAIYDRVSFREIMVQNLSTQAQMIGANSVSALLFDDPEAGKKTLSAMQAAPDVTFAGIVTSDGRLFAAYGATDAAEEAGPPEIASGQTEAHRFQDGEVILTRAIVVEGRSVGSVYLRSTLRALDDRARRYAAIGGLVLSVSLLAALMISWMSQRSISKPLVHLAETARIVSGGKNYSLRAKPTGKRDEIGVLIEDFNEMLSQIEERDAALRNARDELEERVQERTAELTAVNQELEAFSYSVSHDLRAPLRSIDGFSNVLIEDYSEALDDIGKEHLGRVRKATQTMAVLIDDLLKLAKVTRAAIVRKKLDLTALAGSIAEETRRSEPDRQVEFVIEEGLMVEADAGLMRVVMENLIGNAWKYTSAHPTARIEFGACPHNGRPAFFVRDDGAGFDAAYANRLFGAFQRLHAATQFPGTGIGLATVRRIIQRHGGEVWAEGAVEKGATFYFSL
jgi:signal transduction histidine kinase